MNTNNSLSGASDVRPKLSALIKDMCPHGVEFKKLGEVCEILDAKRKPVTKSQRASGEYPYYGANGIQDYVNEYIFDGTLLLIGEDENIINKDKSPVINKKKKKIWVNNHAHILSEKKDIVWLRFLYYYLQTIDVSDLVWGTPPKLNQQNLRSIPIPLPPLEIQEKIVECLDKFSALAAELQAELQMRRKQYEYYRTQLLTPHSDCNSADKTDDRNWEWKTLGEVCEVGTGSHNTQDGLTDGDYPFYTRGTEILRLNTYDFEETAIITAGDGAGVGKVFHYVQGRYALHQRAYRIIANRDFLLPRFLYHYMRFSFYDYIMRNSVSSSVTSVRKPMLEAYPIAFPPLTEQARIVAVLDKFEALTTSLSDGIPAEQAAQQKRYEYYRDLLLTFDRKAG